MRRVIAVLSVFLWGATFLHTVDGQSPFWACNTLDRSVSLTFDDGPSEYTSTLLDSLAEKNVKAGAIVRKLHILKLYQICPALFYELLGSHTF